MSKLYYDDPLVAAYMAREFSVQINVLRDDEIFIDSDIKILLNFAKNRERRTIQQESAKYEIDLGSYDIFQPKLNDLIEWDGINFGLVIGLNGNQVGVQCATDDNGCCDFYTLEKEECTIIQRDVKPFFSPKVEE